MFKKISLIAVFAILPIFAQSQQEEEKEQASDFGFTAGIMESRSDLANTGQIKKIYNPGEHDGAGLFLGLTFDTEFSKNFGLYSELIWAKLEDSDRYLLSTSLKYRLFNSDFHALGGLELNYLGSAPKNAEGEENIKRAGLNGLLGLEYQLNERISFYGNFSFETTNRLKNDPDGDSNLGYHNGRLGVKFRF